MSRKGNLGWVAALLLAAAIVSLAMVLRDLEAPGAARAPAAGALERNLPASSPASAAPMNARLDGQLETLRRGLQAAGRVHAVAPSPAVRMAGLLLPVAGGALCGLAAGLALGRRRAFRAPSVAVEQGDAAARPPAGMERPSRSGSVVDLRLEAGWVEWICALESTTRELARRLDELSSCLLDGRDSARAADRRDSEFGDEAKRSSAAATPFASTGSVEPVEPADPVEPGEPLEAPARAASIRGSGSERVTGFALALGALKGGAGPGGLPAVDRSRVRRAARRLARDGWSEERIAQRLRLDPGEVERTLAPARTGVRR